MWNETYIFGGNAWPWWIHWDARLWRRFLLRCMGEIRKSLLWMRSRRHKDGLMSRPRRRWTRSSIIFGDYRWRKLLTWIKWVCGGSLPNVWHLGKLTHSWTWKGFLTWFMARMIHHATITIWTLSITAFYTQTTSRCSVLLLYFALYACIHLKTAISCASSNGTGVNTAIFGSSWSRPLLWGIRSTSMHN